LIDCSLPLDKGWVTELQAKANTPDLWKQAQNSCCLILQKNDEDAGMIGSILLSYVTVKV